MVTEEIENPTDEEKVCFEIEDIILRQNYAFQVKDDSLVIINTSRDNHLPIYEGAVGHVEYCNLFGIIPTTDYDVNVYFTKMYEKSLKDDRMCFIAWIEKIKLDF